MRGPRLIGSLAAAAILLAVAAPVNAGAASTAPHRVAPVRPPKVRAFRVALRGYSGLQITPAITNGPSVTKRERVVVKRGNKRRTEFVTRTVNSKQDWVVVTQRLSSALISVNSAGKTALVASGLLPAAVAPAGQADALPSYGSAEADGYIWLLDYSVSPAPLYAISKSGHVFLAASLTGDFTDLSAGPYNTLEITDSAGRIDRCKVTKQGTAKCTAVAVPTTFAGGQVDAVAEAAGHVWFTDDDGELGEFSPLREKFTGPYGDSLSGGVKVGDASADPGTIAYIAARGRMYVAAGEDSNALLENSLIRALDPRTGRVLHTYAGGITNVVALTTGADNNIWFLDETNPSTGAGKVGVLNTRTGVRHEYAIPKDYSLPAAGVGIDPGPVGSNTLFFTLQTKVGAHAALGEVTGI